MVKKDYQPYNPAEAEPRLYRLWEEGGYFQPQTNSNKKPFVITLPPPNLTGGLHAGHLMLVIEDIMARYHRMKGEPTLFLPGFDHASIAVEYLVTKQLDQEGISKEELGREKFLERAYQFADKARDYIRDQLKRNGFSLDWSREVYTMDEPRSKAVVEAFNRLYKKGLIYKGSYLVNWCPSCQTAISDLENEHREEEGKFYYVTYGPLTIATTRPETMFADVAVAVNPQDSRYKSLVGQNVPLPLTDRWIPVIEDAVVDMEFGTGALKITPAHDATDYEVGERHNLELVVGINKEGRLTEVAGEFAGLGVVEAREKVVAALREGGFLEKEEKMLHSVGYCQRCDTITEPMISEQWFVKIKPLAEAAVKAVKEGSIEFIPQHFEKTFFHWMENIHDWCISRQLWWGHKVPLEGEGVILDTWFSSSLWPISTLGWPDKTEDYARFYPTDVRETGYDILFFWVAREIMMCLAMTDQVPFKTVYLHGMVRDEQGRKFSKTKGIGFDPSEIVEKYGADALRMALVMGNAPGNDPKITEEKVGGYRNFANKVFNISRFILGRLDGLLLMKCLGEKVPDENWEKEDEQFLNDYQWLVGEVTDLLDRHRYDLAGDKLYHFMWHRLADEYLEGSKERTKGGDDRVFLALGYVFFGCLKMLHPFMPFISEEIWQKMLELVGEGVTSKALIVAPWPKG